MNILLFNICPEDIKDHLTFIDLSNLVPILTKQYIKKICEITLLMANIFLSS